MANQKELESIDLNKKGIMWLTSPDQKQPFKLKYDAANHLHVTLEFGITYEDYLKETSNLKREYTVDIIENCWNDEIQALKVSLPTMVKSLCKNKIPHMTISHKKGVKPFKSNEMLEEFHTTEKVNKTIDLVLDFYSFK